MAGPALFCSQFQFQVPGNLCSLQTLCQLGNFTNKEKIGLYSVIFHCKNKVVLKATFFTKTVGAENGMGILLNLINKHKNMN